MGVDHQGGRRTVSSRGWYLPPLDVRPARQSGSARHGDGDRRQAHEVKDDGQLLNRRGESSGGRRRWGGAPVDEGPAE